MEFIFDWRYSKQRKIKIYYHGNCLPWWPVKVKLQVTVKLKLKLNSINRIRSRTCFVTVLPAKSELMQQKYKSIIITGGNNTSKVRNSKGFPIIIYYLFSTQNWLFLSYLLLNFEKYIHREMIYLFIFIWKIFNSWCIFALS